MRHILQFEEGEKNNKEFIFGSVENVLQLINERKSNQTIKQVLFARRKRETESGNQFKN